MRRVPKPRCLALQAALPSRDPAAPKERLRDWVCFAGGEAEYAARLPAGGLERRLGAALGRASVVVPPNHNLNDLGPAVLKQQGRHAAVLDAERRFESMLDHKAILDRLPQDYLKLMTSKGSNSLLA